MNIIKQSYIFIAIIFLGCSGIKTEFMPDNKQESYMQSTRKTELVFDGRTQIILIATHLNTFDKEKYPSTKGEIFFVDVYQSDLKSVNFLQNGYTLKLSNGEIPLKIQKLKKEELEGLMLKNSMRWGEYYLVEFQPQNKRIRDTIQLVLSHHKYGENTLQFGFKEIKKY